MDSPSLATAPHTSDAAQTLSDLLATRRSVRDFLPNPIAPDVLEAVLRDAQHAPSWSNTQPYRVAIATGVVRDQLEQALTRRFDTGMQAQRAGLWGRIRLALTQREVLPDGDLRVNFAYPADLQPARRATGHRLYALLGIERGDAMARERQMRRNFEFFGAPCAVFLFAHRGLREFSVLDTGIYLQSLMLSAQAHGLGTCAQGALATWAGPVREAFDVPKQYRLVCGVSIGYPSEHPINEFNPGRCAPETLLLARSRPGS